MATRRHKKPDRKFWGQMMEVALAEAVALSIDRVPPRDREVMQVMLEQSREYRDRLAIAVSHLQGGKLPSVSFASDPHESQVKLADFAVWARSIRWSTPQWLSELVVKPDKPLKEDRLLGKRERDTLYVIIAALAEAQKIAVSRPWKAAETIASLTDKIGASVSASGVEDHLKRIPAAIERRSK